MTLARRVPLVVAAAAVVLTLAGGPGWGMTGGPARAAADDPALVAAGRQLYEVGCISCHGPDGAGVGVSPSLKGVGAASADFYIRTGRMPLNNPGQQPLRGPAAYNDHDINALVAYVASLGPGPGIPEVGPGDITAGFNAFQLNCAPCHNVVGAGGALGYGEEVPSLKKATKTQVVQAIRIGPGSMPQWSTEAIPPQEANDIARYVEYLHQPKDAGGLGLGNAGPVAEGFVGLVLGLGALVLAVRLIGTRA